MTNCCHHHSKQREDMQMDCYNFMEGNKVVDFNLPPNHSDRVAMTIVVDSIIKENSSPAHVVIKNISEKEQQNQKIIQSYQMMTL